MSVNATALAPAGLLPPPRVRYVDRDAPSTPRTLARFHFGETPGDSVDGHVDVPLRPLQVPLAELWEVDVDIERGREGALRWAAGGGWLFGVVEVDEALAGGPHAAARDAYAALTRFLAARAESHVLRIWNYLPEINAGEGDAERYKRFCDGRVEGMGGFFRDAYPAATAIGHHQPQPRLQVYWLSAPRSGHTVENPRQTSAWRYPRRYGPTAPTFARAMRLPGDDVLAISGTAAITGHASQHPGDVAAQLDETLANLDALLSEGGMPAGFGAESPLKVYVRRSADAPAVMARLRTRLPQTPLLLLEGDVCRAELLVEIDGWRFR